MSTDTAPVRVPLTRRRILDAALRHIDAHGLAGLSMHKLGAELGVKAMSLYNHVTNKDDVLDGVVEMLWEAVEDAAPARDDDWLAGARDLAHAMRDVLRRHPNAAPLILNRPVMPVPVLRVVRAHINAAIDGGVPEDRAYALLRTLTSYALGSVQAEVTWSGGDCGCRPDVGELLRPGTPDDLAAVAEVFCGQADFAAQFDLGLDLMIRGIDR